MPHANDESKTIAPRPHLRCHRCGDGIGVFPENARQVTFWTPVMGGILGFLIGVFGLINRKQGRWLSIVGIALNMLVVLLPVFAWTLAFGSGL